MFRKYFPLFLLFAFLTLSIIAFLNSKPTSKNERIYKIVKHYSPYYLDKRLGGLKILSKEDKEFKEEPSAMELFKRLEELEKEWGKRHLKVEGDRLIILKDNKIVKEVKLENEEEKKFIAQYYGVKSD